MTDQPPANPYSAAPQPLSPADEKLWATLVHVGGIFFGFIPSLIGFLVLGNRGPFVRGHSATALNFQLTMIIAGAIGAITAWAGLVAFLGMIEKGNISVDDILLLFIYLELGAMVGIYFKTNHMPVRFLIYVAITALTRLLISDVSHHHRPDMGVVYISGAILLLAVAILVVRFASSRFPAVTADNRHRLPRDTEAETLE